MLCLVPDRPAAIVRATVPEMPGLADQQGIYGVVRVRVSVDASGAVTDATIVQSPSRVLDAVSVRAARESAYRPARRNCKEVASSYEFRALFDRNGPRASAPPGPSPTPSPTPAPVPDLARPWRLVWSTGGTSSYVVFRLDSSGKYQRLYDTFPLSHRAECNGRLPTVEMKRVLGALRAARPELWHGSYPVVSVPTPTPSADPGATPVPVVDVVAIGPPIYSLSRIFDSGEGSLKLEAGGAIYAVGYESGETERIHETLPREVRNLTAVLATTTKGCPTPR